MDVDSRAPVVAVLSGGSRCRLSVAPARDVGVEGMTRDPKTGITSTDRAPTADDILRASQEAIAAFDRANTLQREFQTSEMRQGAVQGRYMSDHPDNVGVGWIIYEGNSHMSERQEIPPADPSAPYRIRLERAFAELAAAILSAAQAGVYLTPADHAELRRLVETLK